MRVFHLPAHTYERQRWKNRLGWTLEIARAPSPASAGALGYGWRASIADIEQDCTFSSFPGMKRILLLLRGEGMRIEHSDGRATELLPPYGRIDFSGDEAIGCALKSGATRDFNLIWNPLTTEATVSLRPLVGPMLFFAQAGTTWLIYQCSGHSTLKGGLAQLQAGDSLRLESGDTEAGRWILDGHGEIIVCALRQPASAAHAPS